MPDMSKLFADLQAAIDDMAKKKAAKDKAVDAATAATLDYQDAMTKATNARNALQDVIGNILPSGDGRVRQS